MSLCHFECHVTFWDPLKSRQEPNAINKEYLSRYKAVWLPILPPPSPFPSPPHLPIRSPLHPTPPSLPRPPGIQHPLPSPSPTGALTTNGSEHGQGGHGAPGIREEREGERQGLEINLAVFNKRKIPFLPLAIAVSSFFSFFLLFLLTFSYKYHNLVTLFFHQMHKDIPDLFFQFSLIIFTH